MVKLKKQSRLAVKDEPQFPVINNDGLPPLKKLSMDEYLAFINANIKLFPDLFRAGNPEKWKRECVTARFRI